MRVLHTSDWHLGRSFHGFSLADHQRAVLAALVDVVVDEAVDLVVVSGDLYDRAVPPVEAVEALSSTLVALRGAGATVVAISGNHDSPIRLGFADRVLAEAGIHTWTEFDRAGEPLLVPARHGGPDVVVYPIPYLEPEVAAPLLGLDGARSADRVLRHALGRARHDLSCHPGTRSLVVSHAFVTGGQSSDSERLLSVGGSPEVGLGAFRGFDYVALGHLHGRQILGDGRARYSGSPLAYSFSERSQTKGAWLVDFGPSGPAEVTPIDLPVPRRLAVLEGPVDELLTSRAWDEHEDSWVQATVTDAAIGADAVSRLRRRFPYLCALLPRPSAEGGLAGTYRRRTEGRTDAELAADFWTHATGSRPSADVEALLGAALTHVTRAEPAETADGEAA